MALRGIAVFVVMAGSAVGATAAMGGEFPADNIRAYCDSDPPPDTYWGAREIRGDLNTVVVGFIEGGGDFEVHVENTGTDRDGVPFDSDTSCQRSVDSWRLFEASLGQKADSLRLDGTPDPSDPSGPVPARITAEAVMGAGADVARGHLGKDRFDGGPGKDKLLGAGGKDRLFAADGTRDKLKCGGGRDKVVVDSKDRVAGDCERVKTL